MSRHRDRMGEAAAPSAAPASAPHGHRRALIWGVAAILAANVLLLGAEPRTASALDLQGTCGKRYVAGGDHLPAGHEVNVSERFPSQLLTDHLQPYGWCLLNVSANETTSQTYITGGQLSQTWNFRPDLITLTVGEENATIVNIVNSCFDKVKDHDFSGATSCAAQILGNGSLWTNLTNNLTTTLQQYRMIMAGRPLLVVAVLGYPNPYPTSLSATTDVPLLCVPLQDTIPTCTVRWSQLPPALELIDQVFVKLNSTIQNALKPFQAGPSGNRYVYVDTYTPLRDHCMKMDVSIRTTVNHGQVTHQHDSQRDFGCTDPWYVEGSVGTKSPDYLDPAATGILVAKFQTTSGMGTHLDVDGHDCVASLIWEADTIDPGTTPLKWKLGVPEPADSSPCD
jgi:hypothetical protein